MIEFIVGIIGNLIASYIYDTSFRKPDAKSPPLIFYVQSSSSMSTRQRKSIKVDERAINREQARRTISQLFFFVLTLVLLKYVLYLPILFGNLTNNALDFSKVKIINWLTSATVPLSSVDTTTTIFAVIIYIPLLILGDRLLIVVQRWYDKFWEVTFDRWVILRTMTFVFLSLLASGIVTYLVTSLPFLNAMAAPFIALLILIALGANSSNR